MGSPDVLPNKISLDARYAVAKWADGASRQLEVALIIGGVGDHRPKAFTEAGRQFVATRISISRFTTGELAAGPISTIAPAHLIRRCITDAGAGCGVATHAIKN